jgi:hypothetical protein
MRYAGRPRFVAVSTTTTGPLAASSQSGLAASHGDASLTDCVVTPDTELVLAPSGTFSNGSAGLAGPRFDRYRQLAIAIRQRIETRLAGRVRDLAVRIRGETVVLEGSCATYYSKQLAQHAALGVLDGEPLLNAIVVRM